jgi:hypothetical protein
MSDLDLYFFVSPSSALIMFFAIALCFFGGDPGREERGGVEVFLEVAEDLG